jgi:hypothetical protein
MTTIAVPGPPVHLTDATAGVVGSGDGAADGSGEGTGGEGDEMSWVAAGVGLEAGEAWAVGGTAPQAITKSPAKTRAPHRLKPMS